MENAIFVGLSRQVALQNQMTIIANNIANMNTSGYRAQNAVFREMIEDPKGIEDPLSMVLDYGQFQNTAPGPMRSTENPLDVALQGPGYLGVASGDETLFTRAGSFHVGINGELLTGAGDIVASTGGGPIIIPPEAKDLRITKDGTVTTNDGALGQIMVVEFENVQALEPTGNGLYRTDEAGNPAQKTQVLQGMLEGSNVNAVLEMTRMIDVSRAYQSTQRMLESEHERQRGMIQKLGQSQ